MARRCELVDIGDIRLRDYVHNHPCVSCADGTIAYGVIRPFDHDVDMEDL